MVNMNTQTNVILSISTSPFVIQFIQTVRGVLYGVLYEK